MQKGEVKIEDLKGGVFCHTTKKHCFYSDTILLAHFCFKTDSKVICELGAGCGVISLLLAKMGAKSVLSVDMVENAISLLGQSITSSKLQEVITPLKTDLKVLDTKGVKYDLVVCNPPYYDNAKGKVCSSIEKSIAKHEVLANVYDVCKTAARILKPKGLLCVSMRPRRLLDVFDAMKAAGITPMRVKFCSFDKNSAPFVCLIEGQKGGRGRFEVEPSFFIYDDNKKFSTKMRQIYLDFGWEEKIE